MASKKKPRESLVMGSKKKKKATKKKVAKKRRSTRRPTPTKPASTLRGSKPLVFGTEPPPDTLPAREDERPEYSP